LHSYGYLVAVLATVYYYGRRKEGEGNRREENEKKGKKRDLPDQCQTASYAPVTFSYIDISTRKQTE